MPDATFLEWPFLDDHHRALARDLDAWAAQSLHSGLGTDHDAATIALVRALGTGGWLRWCVPEAYGGARASLDVRALCLIREILARHSPLASYAFAMQGLGSGPISLFGSDALRGRYLARVAKGSAIGAFALSEPDAGSDVSAMTVTARRDGDGFVLDGTKTWISNAGIADFYVVFARMEGARSEERGAREGKAAYLACVVDADNPGLTIPTRIDVIAPHPIGTVALTDCRVGAGAVVGDPGSGLKVALGTLDVFRATVGAAALGFARRALDEAVAWSRSRTVGGKALAEHQLTQARLADMALAVDASALLVYRAAWKKDSGAPRITREAAMAKLFATETAQRVVDDAVQLLGGRGVVSGSPVETLYREVRALRIYEGTSEIQKLVIATQLLKEPS